MAGPSTRFRKLNSEKLKQLRNDRGWSQEDLAERTGLDIRTIERYESGENARPKNIARITDALQVTPATLWADYEPPVPESDGRDTPSQEQPSREESDTARAEAYLVMLEWYKERYESFAGELGVTQSALRNFFKILEQQHLPPDDLDATLREIATSHKQFEQHLQAIDPDNAESSRLYAEALAAAERGDYDHARALLDEADRIDADALEAVEARRHKMLLSRAATSAAKGDSYQTQLRYGEAAECYQQAVVFVEQIPEGREEELACYLILLGMHLEIQGDLARARLYLERALTIREKVLGPEHRDTAHTLNDLGIVLSSQGDFSGSKVYFERALTIQEKVLGPEHLETVTSLGNLGFIRYERGDFSGARDYLERALTIWEKVLGPEHLKTANSMHNLGKVLEVQGDFSGAKVYLERALAIYQKVLGPEHPNTARSMNSLGCFLNARRDFSRAKVYLERALAIYQKVLGPEHPSTARSLNNIGIVLFFQRDFSGARDCFERALAILEKVLGPEHPTTAEGLNNLGAVLHRQEDFSGSKVYYERALVIRKKVLGPEHPTTIKTVRLLALLSQ